MILSGSLCQHVQRTQEPVDFGVEDEGLRTQSSALRHAVFAVVVLDSSLRSD
jgi:hypothetical protein